MTVLTKKRKCPECSGEMQPKRINLLYKKEHCDLQVEVIGIPANVCIKCFDETNIPKCYNNNCGGKFVLPICCKMDGYNYAMACKKCSKEDWIKQYCDMCR